MKKEHVHIIGGGVIGLFTALYLSNEGKNVTIIDKGDFSNGTSFGNAGMIVPSHFVPMASPGILKKGIKWLTNSSSPFYIKPKIDIDLISWLWNFYKHCNTDHVQSNMIHLLNLNQKSKDLFKELSKNVMKDFGLQEKGILMLHRTPKGQHENALFQSQAQSLNLETRMLSHRQLSDFDSAVNYKATGGLLFPGDAHINPRILIQQLVLKIKAQGVEFIMQTAIDDFEFSNSKVTSIYARDRKISVDQLVIANGSWSARLLKKLNQKIFIQSGKGYSLTIEKESNHPNIPTILSEDKVAITPFENHLRISGTLELGNLNYHINKKRVQGIIDSLPKYYSNFDTSKINKTEAWVGHRPCSADGLPYIGKCPNLSNVFVGTGHGMMGVSMAPVTGKLISQLVTEQNPLFDISPFRLDRI